MGRALGARVEKGWLMAASEGTMVRMVMLKTATIWAKALLSAGRKGVAGAVLAKGY